MKIYKIPVQIFEKDLEAKTKKYLVKSKFKLNRKFFIINIALGWTILNIYFQLNYDFIEWVSAYPWWQATVEFVFSAILVLIVWIYCWERFIDGFDLYTFETFNEKLVSKKLRNELFLKLDFNSKTKKGEDRTGSIYVNSPQSKILDGVYTLQIQNKKFITKEVINKNAYDIIDFDDHFDFQKLVDDKGGKYIQDSFFQRVLGGEDEMKIYAQLLQSMNTKYGINIIRIEFLIISFWECKIEDKNQNSRKLLIDTTWGNKIEFANFT